MPHRLHHFQLFLLGILLLGLILAVAGLLIPAANVMLLIFAGLLFGLFLHGIANWLTERSPLAYRTSYLITVVSFLLLTCLGIYYLGSLVTERADEFASELQSAIENAQDRASESGLAEKVVPESFDLQSTLFQHATSAWQGVLSGMQSLGAVVTGVFVMMFVGFYAAYEPQLYRTGMMKLVPLRSRDRAGEVLNQLDRALMHWIIGRLMSMSIVGVLTTIGLYFLDIPLPFTLGVLAALLTFLPNFGPLLAAIPQILLAWNVSPQTALYVAIFNVILQGIESYLITPLIQRREVTLPPILTIAAQLAMGVLVGVLGVMMAAPLVVSVMVIVQMLYVKDYLGDPDPGELTSD
ncbi:AI-2E family transporter [Allorhodopirellula solitaria]|uniref:Pheromone autoinducer 2 transporter n=1 Tax=Allorhodopirellula solitaria TaxID=2527987 RepID=A0A5C5X2C4_9BACT|nr:AI-2E family transporter [Allorhodopirellula solitaria]TWT56315.1 pheromone autoinducer 2 transporter [Allorhodopirellula solitaria]